MASTLASSIITTTRVAIKPLSSRNFRSFAPAAIIQSTGSVAAPASVPPAAAGPSVRPFSILSISNNSQTLLSPQDYNSINHYRNVSNFSARSFVSTSRCPKSTTATVFTDPNDDDGDDGGGKQYGMILDTRNMPELKPSVVKKRLERCKTYEGKERGIRQSPWKINRICQLAAGLTLEEALLQLQFCDLKNADLVAKVLKRTSNLADIRDGLQISQLEVAECFATKSLMLRRIKPMGRGRHGIMHHKFAHIRVVLREIDFPLKIYQQKSLNQKKKWLMHQQRAEQDYQVAKAKRDEMQQLLKQQEELEAKRKAAAEENN
mmetsp:Transcript_53326/g.129612  ORF Transcript_53326/g.129612 Transcript_53326/m.129612 type:complete len:320 (+) Transcript_53326:71-1030(+)